MSPATLALAYADASVCYVGIATASEVQVLRLLHADASEVQVLRLLYADASEVQVLRLLYAGASVAVAMPT